MNSNQQKRIKAIIDTDLGVGTRGAPIDDGIALRVALGATEIEVLGITTVHGNVPVSVGTRNVLRLLYLMHKGTKVVRGASRPIILDHVQSVQWESPSTEIEGSPKLTSAMRRNLVPMAAPRFIIETLGQSQEGITLVCIGPLTNIALALITFPEIEEKIEQIVLMGGSAFYWGNMTPRGRI